MLLLLIVAFLITFPQSIKESLEQRLSEISGLEVSVEKLSLEFQDNELLLAVRGLDIGAAGLNPIASIDVLRWDANLLALYRGIEIPGHIDINELVIDTSSIDEYISIINTDSVFSNLGLSGILALQTLSVNSTVLIGDESVQLAPIELKRNKEKIIVSMENQPLITDSEMPKLGNTVNIKTSIDVARARADRVAVIPFTIKNEDFNLSAQLKIFSQQDKVYLEFQSYIDQIDVTKINQNIPEVLANTQSTIWLDKVITEGMLTDIMLTTRFNISGELETPNTKFSANLKDAKLNVNSSWTPITDLNAKVTFSNDYINITGKNAKLDVINLSYFNISTRNFNKPEAQLVLDGRFNSDSETISQFIKQSPVPVRVKDYLNEFELSGDIWGNVSIVAPFQKDTKKKFEIQEDETLLSKKIEIAGLYDPVENGLTIDMWSNSNGVQILDLLNKIQGIKLSDDAKEILKILLLTNSYFPQQNISNEQFLELKLDWLIKNGDFKLMEDYLMKNPNVDKNEKLIIFLVDEYLSRSELEKSCEIISNIKEAINNNYLSKFNIYCLINANRKEEAQLQLDIKKELGFDDNFFEKKFNYLMGYNEEVDQEISEKSILDFHLSHKTNPKFKFIPNESTSSSIWRYLSTSNLLEVYRKY